MTAQWQRRLLLSPIVTSLASISVLTTSCATPAVLARWRNQQQVASVRLRLIEASAASVRLVWQAEVNDEAPLKGDIAFNPQLVGCEAVAVVLLRNAGDVRIPMDQDVPLPANTAERRLTTDSFWQNADHPECTVLLRLRPAEGAGTVELVAATYRGSKPVVETFAAPRQTQWLFLLPFSVAADATLVTLVIPPLWCRAMGNECGRMLMDAANSVAK